MIYRTKDRKADRLRAEREAQESKENVTRDAATVVPQATSTDPWEQLRATDASGKPMNEPIAVELSEAAQVDW